MVRAAVKGPIYEMKTIIATVSRQQAESSKETLAAIHYGRQRRPEERDYNPAKRWAKDWRAEKEPGDKDKEPETRVGELKRIYQERYGRLNGSYWLCEGFHFRRHCPLDPAADLKE